MIVNTFTVDRSLLTPALYLTYILRSPTNYQAHPPLLMTPVSGKRHSAQSYAPELSIGWSRLA